MKQINIDIFDSEEKLFINRSFDKVRLKDFTRESFLENLTFSLEIQNDDMLKNTMEKMRDKIIRHVSEEEWEKMKIKLPFFVPYDENEIELES